MGVGVWKLRLLQALLTAQNPGTMAFELGKKYEGLSERFKQKGFKSGSLSSVR